MRPSRMTVYALCATLAAALVATSAMAAADETWDGLVPVDAKQVQKAYLLPGADFRGYDKVIIDPPVVEFRKNWQRDLNRSASTINQRLSSSDVEQIRTALAEGFEQILAAGFAADGWEVGIAEGPDVLRITPMLVNVSINAPDTMSAGRSATYAVEAGEATLALEVRDAETGQLLGRAIDRRRAGDMGSIAVMRNRVTNRADFERLLKQWTGILVGGLAGLKAASPLAISESDK